MTDANTAHNIGIASQIGSYSDAVEAPASGRLLFISGTPGLTKDGQLPETFDAQADQAWLNIIAILKQANMKPEHLVKVTVYLMRQQDVIRAAPIRKKHLGDYQPAAMLAVVPALVRPGFLIEIEAIAVAPK